MGQRVDWSWSCRHADVCRAPRASRQALASPAERPAAATYQVTLSVGTGVQYDVLPGRQRDLADQRYGDRQARLAAATVLVQYDRSAAAPDGVCPAGRRAVRLLQIGWDRANGLVRFNILSQGGDHGQCDALHLTFEPAATAMLHPS